MMDVMLFFLLGGVAVVFAGLVGEVQRFYDFPSPSSRVDRAARGTRRALRRPG